MTGGADLLYRSNFSYVTPKRTSSVAIFKSRDSYSTKQDGIIGSAESRGGKGLGEPDQGPLTRFDPGSMLANGTMAHPLGLFLLKTLFLFLTVFDWPDPLLYFGSVSPIS